MCTPDCKMSAWTNEPDLPVLYKPVAADGTAMPDEAWSFETCTATSGPGKQGYGCTLPYDHPSYCPHMAGTGEHIAAMWYA